jgi:hypothetical protein
MSDILTVADVPGVFGAGFMNYGRLSRAEIIRQTKELYAYNKEVAEKVLATPDDDFDVRIVRGVHVQHLVERLLP